MSFFLTEVICEIQLVQLFWSKKREGSSCYFECSPLQSFSLVFSISYHTFLSCRILLPKGVIGVVVLFLCCMAWKLFFRLLLRFAICSFLFLGVELIKKLKTFMWWSCPLTFILSLIKVFGDFYMPCFCCLGMVSNWTKIPPPLFKKVVIVLIDALRDDFVFGPKGKQFMPYTTQVVEKGTSYSFIAEAKPPTVTMPRIKVNGIFFYHFIGEAFEVWGVSYAWSWHRGRVCGVSAIYGWMSLCCSSACDKTPDLLWAGG